MRFRIESAWSKLGKYFLSDVRLHGCGPMLDTLKRKRPPAGCIQLLTAPAATVYPKPYPKSVWPICDQNCLAHEVYWTVGDGTECKNPKKSVVAATLEKARTYVFAEPLVWDREVGGSNPLSPTKNLNPIDNLRGVD